MSWLKKLASTVVQKFMLSSKVGIAALLCYEYIGGFVIVCYFANYLSN